MNLILFSILFVALFWGGLTYLMIRFPKNKTTPRHILVRRGMVFFAGSVVVAIVMFFSCLFFGTINLFTGLCAFVSVKTLGSAYAETYSHTNEVFVSLNKFYIIEKQYDDTTLEKTVAAAYAGTPYAAQKHTVVIDYPGAKIEMFTVYDERGQCGTGVITRHRTHTLVELDLNLY